MQNQTQRWSQELWTPLTPPPHTQPHTHTYTLSSPYFYSEALTCSANERCMLWCQTTNPIFSHLEISLLQSAGPDSTNWALVWGGGRLARWSCSAILNSRTYWVPRTSGPSLYAFWVEINWLEGGPLAPSPSWRLFLWKPQRGLCSSGADFGGLPQHNAGVYLSIPTRTAGFRLVSSNAGYTGWTNTQMAICLSAYYPLQYVLQPLSQHAWPSVET